MSFKRHGGASRSRTKFQSPAQELRLRAGVTVAEVATAFQVSRACASRWLSGRRECPLDVIAWLELATASQTAHEQEQFSRRVTRRRAISVKASGPDRIPAPWFGRAASAFAAVEGGQAK